jgi:hypothetical protein
MLFLSLILSALLVVGEANADIANSKARRRQ